MHGSPVSSFTQMEVPERLRNSTRRLGVTAWDRAFTPATTDAPCSVLIYADPRTSHLHKHYAQPGLVHPWSNQWSNVQGLGLESISACVQSAYLVSVSQHSLGGWGPSSLMRNLNLGIASQTADRRHHKGQRATWRLKIVCVSTATLTSFHKHWFFFKHVMNTTCPPLSREDQETAYLILKYFNEELIFRVIWGPQEQIYFTLH